MAEKEDEVLEFIKNYKRSHQGTSPSMQEVADACGLSARSHAKYYMDILQEQGHIIIHGTRNISILDPEVA